jgi:homoserine kinase
VKNNQKIKIFSPATVANVSCGFDVLGLCLDAVGDEMLIRKSQQKGIKITKITGQNLPLEATKNVAGVAALALLDKIDLDLDFGFEMEIVKNIKPGSGIGSSAASAAGAVFAINELLGKPFSPLELTEFAMQGEKLAGGTAHADNVAPALFGGFTLVRASNPLDVISLPTPINLFVVILHPQVEIKTSESRTLLPKEIPLALAIKQWGNLGALVSSLYTDDYNLLSKALKDHIVTPYRSQLIPYYTEIETLVLDNKALGFGISGSGPSMFSLVKGEEKAHQIKELISHKYKETNISFHCFVSKINPKGVKII